MRNGGVFAELRSVSKRYGTGFGLSDATLTISFGDDLGLIGLNGAGKSTFLKLLLGFARPTAGQITLQNLSPGDAYARKGIGYLSETLILPRNLTPIEIIETVQRIAPNGNRFRSPSEWLEWAGLSENRWRVPCSALSKGQAQRVGLAQAFATADSALILDEPSTGLDPVGRADLLRMIRSWKTPEKTLILTSHILSDVEALCSLLCVLHEGRIQFYGETSEFIRKQGAQSLREAFLRFIACLKS